MMRLVTGAWAIDLPVLAPLEGVTDEAIETRSTSLHGTTTRNIRAYKRRWDLQLKTGDTTLAARLRLARRQFSGPWTLIDSTEPNMLSVPARRMENWRSPTALLVPDEFLRLKPPTSMCMPGGAANPEMTPIVLMTHNVSMTGSAPVSSTVYLCVRWYGADRTYLSQYIFPCTVGSTEKRFVSPSITPPPGAFYAGVAAWAANDDAAVISDITLTAGTTSTIVPAPRYTVHIDDVKLKPWSPSLYSIQLAMSEV